MRSWFVTYTRYSGVVDEEQKKRSLGVFYDSFWVIFVQGCHSFYNFSKGGYLKKSLGNPGLNRQSDLIVQL